MKRNLISLLLVIVMVLSTVAGCATKEDTTDTATTKTTATEEKSTEAETEEKKCGRIRAYHINNDHQCCWGGTCRHP